MTTYEKIETIILSCLANGTLFGSFGTVIRRGPNHFRVYADGKRFTVKSTTLGWEVRHGLICAINPELLEAARDCVTG